MTVVEEVLAEEYARSLRITAALERKISQLPRGSIRARVIGSGTYYYLQWREGAHVRSKYVRVEELSSLKQQLALRKKHISALKEQERTRRQIERALGGKPL